jgi:hypothetical protein
MKYLDANVRKLLADVLLAIIAYLTLIVHEKYNILLRLLIHVYVFANTQVEALRVQVVLEVLLGFMNAC